MNNLIIFDIDGTLTQTNEVDSRCFEQAVKNILQVKNINTNWSDYIYSTDSGLIKEIYDSLFQREPALHEIKAVQDRFVYCLQNEYRKDKNSYLPIAGAKNIFKEIFTLKNWHIGIGTGGWKPSALFKLKVAEIEHHALPKGFADDHIERTEIIKLVIKQAHEFYKIDHYKRIIYVGDRPWDLKAAKALNLEFIGVGSEWFNHPKEEIFCMKDYQHSAPLLDYLSG